MDETYIKNIQASGAVVSAHGVLGDASRKVCVLWSPRAGCSVTSHAFLDMLGLRCDAVEYSGSHLIHYYRTRLYNQYADFVPLQKLKSQRYRFIKVIVNPFRRAVSIWHIRFNNREGDPTFREWARNMAQAGNDSSVTDGMCEDEKFHSAPQYNGHVESFVSEYLRLDRDEVKSINGFEFRPAKYSSRHHAQKVDCDAFVGDLRRSQMKKRLPKNYKHFYDDEIRSNITQAYRDDVEHYGYSLEDLR